MTARRLRSQIISLAIGLIATLAVLVFHLIGRLDWLERAALDLRFAYANSIPQNERITCVDIDDQAITDVGRWPWPRDKQAMIFRALTDLGSRVVLVDLNWIEHETVRTEQPADADLLLDPRMPVDGRRLLPDSELRAAIRDAGNVYLAFDFPLANELSARSAPASQPSLRMNIRVWLGEHQPPGESPDKWWGALYKSLTDRSADDDTPFRREFFAALRSELGLEAMLAKALPTSDAMASTAMPTAVINAVHFRVGQVAKGFGFVVFNADPGGVVRRLPPLISYRNHVFPQLALAVACDVLGMQPSRISVQGHSLVLDRSPAGLDALAIQLDSDGEMMIPWVPEPRWEKQFTHVTANEIWNLMRTRENLAANTVKIRDTVEQVVYALVEDKEGYAGLLKLLKEAQEAERAIRLFGDGTATPELADRVALLRRKIDAIEKATVQELNRTREQMKAAGQTDLKSEEIELFAQQLESNHPYEEANARLNLDIAEKSAKLSPRIAGKICLLGYTATALADMKPFPTNKSAPGVMAHANVLNGILVGRSVGWTLPATDVGMILVLGLIGAIITAWRPPLQALWLVILTTIAFLGGAGFLAFYYATCWVLLIPPVAALLSAFVAISLYQYGFVDRERRQLASALSQYTSKTIARQMAENPELCKRAETREVTTVFTDLRGFTQISEHIGAARTQQVLNICLGRFTDVLLQHEAMINKFIGDGIFAFWNPVIFPQADHAMRACESAVDLIAALRELIAEQAERGGDEAFAELELRIGIATGNAVVGPCGSEQKYDYTCIGDSVNVSARLESANKFYGTKILVSGATRDAVGDKFVFRSLGAVRVKGKREVVSIYELLGRTGAVAPRAISYAELFGRGVTCFQKRRFDDAQQAFDECHKQWPEDRAASAYAEAIAQYLEEPPGEDWTGGIELTEK